MTQTHVSAVAGAVRPSGPADPWAVLHDAAAPPADHCRAWLGLQCGMIPGARAGLLSLTQAGVLAPVAAWPQGADLNELARLAARAVVEQRLVVAWGRREASAPDALPMLVAQPIGPDGAAYGAVAVSVLSGGAIGAADPDGVGRLLRSGAGWLDALGVRQHAAAAVADRDALRLTLTDAHAAMDTLAVAGEHRRLASSSMAVVNELATRLGCARVSIGVAVRGRVRLQAMSHTATIQRASRLAGSIEDAMNEALAQGCAIAHPAVPDMPPSVSVMHRDLVRHGIQGAVLSVPLGTDGVLTLERAAPFDARALQLIGAVAALLGPTIALQAHNQRWIAGRAADAGSDGLRLLFGPRRPALKLMVLGTALTLMALAVLPGTHRVSTRATLEGDVQRAAVAPFDGFVREAPARAGDTVRKGDLLAAFEDRELVLERVKAWAEREKLRARYQDALSKHDRPQTAVLTAQIDQAEAQLALAEDRLARARVVAPLDGVIVSGDLSQTLGSPVERGRVLFEVAPQDAVRLALQVEDQDVRWVQTGQTGTVALASMPGQRLGFTVLRRTPVASADDGRNVFRVEALLDDARAAPLRPGMEGVAKIEIGSARLLWVWVHPMWDAMRLTVWKWLP